jgi:magnesium-transporting ATPase (P-type)
LVMILMELIGIQIIRGRYHLKLFSNMWLIWAITLSIVLTLIVIYSPLHIFFGTVTPSIMLRKDIIIIMGIATIIWILYNKLYKKPNPINKTTW